jgi:hypothetical protein
MNVEIGAEAALFPEKEYINGGFAVAVCFELGTLIEIEKCCVIFNKKHTYTV